MTVHDSTRSIESNYILIHIAALFANVRVNDLYIMRVKMYPICTRCKIEKKIYFYFYKKLNCLIILFNQLYIIDVYHALPAEAQLFARILRFTAR